MGRIAYVKFHIIFHDLFRPVCKTQNDKLNLNFTAKFSFIFKLVYSEKWKKVKFEYADFPFQQTRVKTKAKQRFAFIYFLFQRQIEKSYQLHCTYI